MTGYPMVFCLALESVNLWWLINDYRSGDTRIKTPPLKKPDVNVYEDVYGHHSNPLPRKKNQETDGFSFIKHQETKPR